MEKIKFTDKVAISEAEIKQLHGNDFAEFEKFANNFECILVNKERFFHKSVYFAWRNSSISVIKCILRA